MRIVAAVLLLGIIPLGAAGGSLWVGWRALARTTYRQVAQMPLGAATRIAELLYFRYVDSIQFASNAAAVSGSLDREVQSSLFRRLKELYQPYAWLGLVDANGVVTAGSDPVALGKKIPQAYWADNARRRSDGVLLTDVHPSAVYPDLPVVGFSVPVAKGAPVAQGADGDGTPAGYVYTEVSVAFLARHITDVDPGQDGQVLLVDRDGRVIADRLGAVTPGAGRMIRYGDAVLAQGWDRPASADSPPAAAGSPTPTGVSSLAAFQAARAGQSGTLRERVAGRDTLVGYAPLNDFGPYPGQGWSLLVLVPTRQALASVISQAWFTALILLVGLLLAIAVSIYLSNRFTVPLLRLVDVTNRARAGHLSDDFPAAGTGDEIEQLTEGFRSMVRAVALKQSELEEAHRLQSEFLTNITHESRTPLAAILAVSEVLEQEVAGPMTEKQTQYVRSIAANAQKVLEWINNLLDLARAEAGRIELKLQPVALPAVADSVRDTIEGLARPKNIEYREEWPDLPLAEADPDRVRQIILNLLGNAVKFTPEGGRVLLGGVRPQPGWVGLFVRDNGIGIAPEDRERIFEKFQQVDNSTSRRYPGSGLGLALVRHLVELHGGSITVESAAGEGTTFQVLLPEAREAR